jgi:hypothetical protein
MIKALMCVVGLLIVGGAVYAAWTGDGVNRDMEKLDMEIVKQTSENAYKHAGEEGDKKIAAIQKQIEEKKGERNIWFGAAIGGGIVGLVLALLPFTGKRKVAHSGMVTAQDQAPVES